MASILASQTCRSLRLSRAVCTIFPQRTIHASAVVQKKKGKDIFADDISDDGDLFSANTGFVPGQKPVREKNLPGPVVARLREERKKNGVKVDPAVKRRAKLEKQMAYIKSRQEVNKVAVRKLAPARPGAEAKQRGEDDMVGAALLASGKTPPARRQDAFVPPRRRLFKTMCQLAMNEEELSTAIELLPAHRNAGGPLPNNFASIFAARCQVLKCQHLALKVFGDYAKYKVPLDLPAARTLLHSVYLDAPIEQVLIVVSYYDIYSLPDISEDLPSAALVAAAASKFRKQPDAPEETKQKAKDLLDMLLPRIKVMLNAKGPENLPPQLKQEEDKVDKLVAWAVKRIDKFWKQAEGVGYFDVKSIPVRYQFGAGVDKTNVAAPAA